MVQKLVSREHAMVGKFKFCAIENKQFKFSFSFENTFV